MKNKIFIAQLNSWVGDISQNAERMFQMVQQTPVGSLVLFPELAMTGYPPRDLLDWDEFRNDVLQQNEKFIARVLNSQRSVIFGSIGLVGTQLRNRAYGVLDGKTYCYDKQLLPYYDVFDEGRHFEAGPPLQELWYWQGLKIGISICEDIWSEVKLPHLAKFLDRFHARPMKQGADLGADVLVNLSASPFEHRKGPNKEKMVGDIARELQKPILYVNGVGGNDDVVLDGSSFSVSAKGVLDFRSPLFQEALVEWKQESSLPGRGLDEILPALELGIKDYFAKSGNTQAIVGMSGGIDSAVVLGLLVRVLKPENVSAVYLPTRFSSSLSQDLAQKQSAKWGVQFRQMEIENLRLTMNQFLQSQNVSAQGLTLENLQSRIRGLVLMSLSNAENRLLISTGNKSEIAMGYCTLYGDTNGALAPLGDLTKTQVREIAEKIGVLPEIIERVPTAELRENQKDEDSLPPYSELDQDVVRFTEGRQFPKNPKIRKTLHRMEFKRRQMPLVVKVSPQAFGPGRRMPLNHLYT